MKTLQLLGLMAMLCLGSLSFAHADEDCCKDGGQSCCQPGATCCHKK
jgi:hypothetical protein